MITFLHGDTTEQQRTLETGCAQMIVTSPPYWRLRKYTDDDPREIGQEPTCQAYVAALVAVFAESWRVLRDDGTLWLNIGDAYANDTKWGGASGGKNYTSAGGEYNRERRSTGLPPKSLMGLPWRVAFALQDEGWILRSEIIWEKPNGMPESVDDRPTMVHEHIFLFAKQGDYYYDAGAIAEPVSNIDRRGSHRIAYKGKGNPTGRNLSGGASWLGQREDGTRNSRTIWRVNTRGLPDEHYAPYPDELARRCILAGSKPGDIVLDPFAGSGTTMRVAETLGRNSIGIDLGYQELQEKRTNNLQMTIEAYL